MPPVDRRLRRLPVVLVSLLVVAACGSQTATPPPSPTSPPTAPPTAPASAPASQAPTPSASAADPNAALYTEIEAQVRELRGLDATATVERSVLDEAGLRDYITTSFAKDNPEPLIAGTEGLLKGLGLLPEADSLRDLYIELLTSQVAGLYDDDTKQMYVVSRTGEIGPAEQVTYAHEYDHALQDQHFGLSSLVGEAKDQGDRTLARTALAEGDATLLMSLWAQQHLTPAELADLGSSVDPASQAVLDRMPPILRDTLTFPYTGGLSYLLGDFAAGGWDAVNAQWSTPPVSTEQVLHADKRSEPPVAVSFPDDLASRLGSGWSVAIQDTLGEYQLGILLDDVGDVGQAASADAAAGWGGDRVALLEGPGAASAVVLESAWDSAKDADQFRAAADDVVGKLKAGGRSAAVLAPSGKRVVLISAGDADTLARVANVLGLAG